MAKLNTTNLKYSIPMFLKLSTKIMINKVYKKLVIKSAHIIPS